MKITNLGFLTFNGNLYVDIQFCISRACGKDESMEWTAVDLWTEWTREYKPHICGIGVQYELKLLTSYVAVIHKDHKQQRTEYWTL